jgi:hypothetical protein
LFHFFFFRLDLLGGDPAWQVVHGLPFAITGVASALDTVSELIATVRKNKATAAMTALTIPDLIIFADRMCPPIYCMNIVIPLKLREDLKTDR